jgi:hypothetical protein
MASRAHGNALDQQFAPFKACSDIFLGVHPGEFL